MVRGDKRWARSHYEVEMSVLRKDSEAAFWVEGVELCETHPWDVRLHLEPSGEEHMKLQLQLP